MDEEFMSEAPPDTAAQPAAARTTARSADPHLGRNLLIGISFANLCFFKIWSALLTYTWRDTYLMKEGATPADLIACIVNVLVIGCLLGYAATWIERRLTGFRTTLADWAFLGALLVPLNALRAVFVVQFPHLRRYALIDALGMKGFLALCAFLGLTAVVIVIFFHRHLVRIAAMLLAFVSVFAAFNIARAAMKAANYDPRPFADKPAAPMLANARKTPRIVWMICDEWDERLTFNDRDPSIKLPEIDRFHDQAIHSDHAFPPSGQTPWSLPAVTTGRLVAEVKPLGPDDLLLIRPKPEAPEKWRETPNIFSQARAMGYNVGIAGYYHPYCRMFNDSVSACSWWPTALQYNSMGNSFWQILPNQVRSLFETDSRSLFGQALAVRQHGFMVRDTVAHAERMVTNPDMGFVFLHIPVPHAPYAWDRRTGQYALRSPVDGYWDSLVLLDRILGALRGSMEKAGLWDGATVLMSSDHWNRASELLDGKKEHRIPFLLKMAGQKEGVDFEKPFNTVLSHDLVLGIMRGEIADARAAVEWLDKHRTIADSPYSYDEQTF
jgi:Sulfatase